VFLAGELDLTTGPVLRSELLELVRDGYVEVELDVRDVEFADAAGLGTLVGAAARLRSAGGDLVLQSVPKRILHVLKLTGLDELFTIGS
jgi:anti-sigma B factor antagonist